MKSALRCFVAFAMLAGPLIAQGAELDPMITASDLWQTPQKNFIKSHPKFAFHWLSAAADRAETTSKGVTLFGKPVYAVDADFPGAKTLTGLTISVFNHGDAGDITREQMTALVAQTVTNLNTLTGVQGADLGLDPASAVKAYTFQWKTPATQYLLTYSFTREVKTQSIPFRAEFVRLEVQPAEKAQTFMAQALAAATPASAQPFDALAHVKKNAAGDVEIQGVPMVDQGDKGYCVDASVERVMRYYGIPVDEHEMAELASSSAEMGTSYDAMLTSLKGLSQKFKLNTHEIERTDDAQLNQLVNQYNIRARRAKIEELHPAPGRLYVQQLYESMRPDLLKAARTVNQGDIDKFQQTVQDQIEKGIPILWSMMYGVVPEKLRQPALADTCG